MYLYMLYHSCKCNSRFISTEPKGCRPKVMVQCTYKLSIAQAGVYGTTNLFLLEAIWPYTYGSHQVLHELMKQLFKLVR